MADVNIGNSEQQRVKKGPKFQEATAHGDKLVISTWGTEIRCSIPLYAPGFMAFL